MRVGSEDRNFRADVVGRMQSASAKHVCRHCGRSRFAVHAGDDNAALGLHDCSDGFRPAQQWLSGITSRDENGVVVPDGGGKNNKLRGVRVLWPMLSTKPQPQPLQSICLCGCGLVRAADCVSELDEKSCETAHAASRHTDEMNPMVFARQKSRQIGQRLATAKFFARRTGACGSCFRRELHESHIFPSCSPRGQLHLSARAARNSPPFVGGVAGFELARGLCARAIRRKSPTV